MVENPSVSWMERRLGHIRIIFDAARSIKSEEPELGPALEKNLAEVGIENIAVRRGLGRLNRRDARNGLIGWMDTLKNIYPHGYRHVLNTLQATPSEIIRNSDAVLEKYQLEASPIGSLH